MTVIDDLAALPPGLRFLAGGGEATRLILARDWSDHVLGPPEGWPDGLKVSLSTVLNSPESLILAWGADDLTFFFNETYFPLLGPRLAWAMGAPFTQVWADGWAQAKPIIDAAFAGRATRFEDMPWKLDTDRGAEETWWSFSYSRILDPAGEIAGLFILTSETTQKVLSERRGRETEQQLQRAQDAGGIGMFVVDAAGILRPTASFCKLYGMEVVEQSPAAPFEALVLPEDRMVTSDTASRAQGQVMPDVEYRIRRADTGEIRWIGRKGEIELDAEGRFARFSGVARDITEQVEDRQALAAEREQLAQMFEQAPTFMAILEGPEHRLVRANPGYLALIDHRDVIGRTLAEALPDAVEQGFLAILDEVYRSGTPYVAKGSRFDSQAGPDEPVNVRYIDFVFQPLRAAGGAVTGIFVEGADVTQRSRAEEDLRLLNAELEARVEQRTAALMAAEEHLRQSQKMEALGQLTGGVAHDFNNLLTPIVGSLDMLARREGGTDRERRLIDGALQSAERARILVQRLLAFARRQPLQSGPVDVVALIEGMAELVTSTSGPQIRVQVKIDAPVPPAIADANQLEMAILNLCVNARDAMPDGGTLTIAATGETIGQNSPLALPPGRYVRLTVADTGIGMDEDTAKRAIEPFYSTKGIGKGTGLGLSMVHGLAAQLNGALDIRSQQGLGTRIDLLLPVAQGAAAPDAPAPETAPAALRGRVLVVDDEEIVRMTTSDMLQQLGYETVEVDAAREALDLLTRGAAFDLVVTDHMMPGMSGGDLVQTIRSLRPSLPVLLVSGYAEAEDVAGDVQRLAKPFRQADLARALAEIV